MRWQDASKASLTMNNKLQMRWQDASKALDKTKSSLTMNNKLQTHEKCVHLFIQHFFNTNPACIEELETQRSQQSINKN